jgi:hypothetical protein
MTDTELLAYLNEIDDEITSTLNAFDRMINNLKMEVNNGE